MKTKHLLMALVAILCACNHTDPEAIPVANFTFTIDNLNVQFTNQSRNATTYLWSFGDGTTSDFVNPSHTYPGAGTYYVTLQATNSERNHQISKQVVIKTDGTTPTPIDNNYCIVNVVNKTPYTPSIKIAGYTIAFAEENATMQLELYERWETVKILNPSMGSIEQDVLGKSVPVEILFLDLVTSDGEIPSVTKNYMFQKGRKYTLTIISSTKVSIELQI